MSIREDIAADLVKTLKDAKEPLNIKMATREPFDFNRLSAAQFPACLITTTSEIRSDVTISDDATRQATITYQIEGYTKSSSLDESRNKMIETIEEALDVDRTRGGNAKDTQVIAVEVDDGSIQPYAAVLVTVEVMYTFTRGTT